MCRGCAPHHDPQQRRKPFPRPRPDPPDRRAIDHRYTAPLMNTMAEDVAPPRWTDHGRAQRAPGLHPRPPVRHRFGSTKAVPYDTRRVRLPPARRWSPATPTAQAIQMPSSTNVAGAWSTRSSRPSSHRAPDGRRARLGHAPDPDHDVDGDVDLPVDWPGWVPSSRLKTLLDQGKARWAGARGRSLIEPADSLSAPRAASDRVSLDAEGQQHLALRQPAQVRLADDDHHPGHSLEARPRPSQSHRSPAP